MALCPSSVPLCVPLRAPLESSLPEVPDPECDRACASSPIVSRLLTIVVTDPSFESTAAAALVADLVDFATACCLDYATAPVAECESASPTSVEGECALGTDVLEDRQEDFECLAAAVPRFASMLRCVGVPGGAGAGGAGAAGAGTVDLGAEGAGGTVRPRPYFVPLLQQVLGVPSSTRLTPPLLCPSPDQTQPSLLQASPLPAPSPYTEQSGGLIEHREPASRPVSPVRTTPRVPRSRPPPVPGTYAMALRPISVPVRVPLPAPPESSLSKVPDPESDRARAASPTLSRLLATAVTEPSFESAAASALVVELVDFAVAYRLDYATALVSESAFSSPPSIGGECVLDTDVLEDRQEDFECLATAILCFASMMLAPEGDSDAPDIPTPHSYAEAITGPYSSQWQAAMDAEMATWKSTGTYVDEVPPPRANIVNGMWILRMTTLRVLLHVDAKRDYELHSLDFSTAFLQGSLHEGIWLRRPPGFTGTFPTGTQSSLRRPVYGLRQAPREWHKTPRTTLAAPGFAPSTADLSLFLRTDTSLPPFYVLVTSGMGLVLGGQGPVVLTGHADASWVDDSATQRSSQGYTFSLGSGSVSWRSTRSSLVLSSSCEAEIYSGAMAAQIPRVFCDFSACVPWVSVLWRSRPHVVEASNRTPALAHVVQDDIA
ncbi:unnamed protein product [Closterium sp. NIES-53]